jgi:SpoVK/Ycf46/Vps4 family AAA+-type ATPase
MLSIPQNDEYTITSGRSLPQVELLPHLGDIESLVSKTCEFFFKGKVMVKNNPFKGFLIEGTPGTGKTELVKQVAHKLDRRMKNVYFLFVDGASIASPKWGEAEQKLRRIFRKRQELHQSHNNPKLLILFDDIESLMISRGAELAKEWHYSINSILFHEIDALDPLNTILLATTNRIDLVDDAIISRLYSITVDHVPVEQLKKVVMDILNSTSTEKERRSIVQQNIFNQLTQMDSPTIRDAQKITVIECIRSGLWSI